MSETIGKENGARNAAASFHGAVNINMMRCLICPENVAVWRVKKTHLRLSPLAATTLIDNGVLSLHDLKL